MSNSNDEMRTSFDEVVKMYGLINQPKRLIQDGEFKKEFEAGGKKYVVCPPELVFNFDKQIAFKNLEVSFGLCQTPSEVAQRFVDNWNTMTRLMGAKGKDHDRLMGELHRQAMNNVDSFKQNIEHYYPPALYICTLFIMQEGEDLAQEWTFNRAKEKLKDWFTANYSAYDFFCLALSVSPESRAIIQQNLKAT